MASAPRSAETGTSAIGEVGQRERDHLGGHQPAALRGDLTIVETLDEPLEPQGVVRVAAGRTRPRAPQREQRTHSQPEPETERNRHGPTRDEVGPDRRQLRLPQVREVGDAADETDHRADQQDPVERLDPASSQSPDRSGRRDPDDDRDEVVTEELQRLDHLRARAVDLGGRRVDHVDRDQHHQRRDRGPTLPPRAKKPAANIAATSGSHGHPLGPGTQVSEPRTSTVWAAYRNATVHCRIDRVHGCGDRPGRSGGGDVPIQ